MAFKDSLFPLILLSLTLAQTNAANILFVSPTPSYSHQIFFRPIVFELLKRGHSVTLLTTDPIKDPSLTNLTEIDMTLLYTGSVLKKSTWGTPTKLKVHEGEQSAEITKYLKGAEFYFGSLVRNPGVQDLIKNNTNYHFDLVVMEALIPLFSVFAEVYKCPLVGVLSMPHSLLLDYLMRSTLPLTYGTALNVPYLHPMSLWERWENLYYHWVVLDSEIETEEVLNKVIYREFGPGLPDVKNLMERMRILMVNAHAAFIPPKPNLPGVINIGGMHRPKINPLPEDIQVFLDSAEEGAIYFSLGTNVLSQSIDDNTLNVIIDTLADLPFKVLWKWDTETFTVPSNVLLREWFPQNDVLHHPNVKAFITQGGLQSLEEAIHAQVPVIGIPIVADQHFTVNRVHQLEIGRKQRYMYLNKPEFQAVILDVATNPKYKTNMVNLARVYQDQMVKPLDSAVWWIEHAIRTNGGEYMRNKSLEYSDFQFFMLDFVLIVVCVVLLLQFLLFIVVKVLLCLISLLCCRKKQQK